MMSQLTCLTAIAGNLARLQGQRERCTALGRRGKQLTRHRYRHGLTGCKIEYLVVCYDQNNHKVRLSLRQADILAALATDEKLLAEGGGVPDVQTGDTK
jgi:hypothetical protein